MNRFILMLLLLFFPSIAAQAQCVNPPAEMGVVIFNKAHKVMQYCNGEAWVGLGGGNGAADAQRISGEVATFDLDACPEGWSPYAPSSGRFIRGRCISGQPCNDPDGVRIAGSTQADALGSHNHSGTANSAGAHTHTGTTSSAGAHTHNTTGTLHTGGGSGHIYRVVSGSGSDSWRTTANSTTSAGAHSHSLTIDNAGAHTHTLTINATGGAETRPRNVALLYCRKD